jgi:hypothetical protein
MDPEQEEVETEEKAVNPAGDYLINGAPLRPVPKRVVAEPPGAKLVGSVY